MQRQAECQTMIRLLGMRILSKEVEPVGKPCSSVHSITELKQARGQVNVQDGVIQRRWTLLDESKGTDVMRGLSVSMEEGSTFLTRWV